MSQVIVFVGGHKFGSFDVRLLERLMSSRKTRERVLWVVRREVLIDHL